MKVSAVNDREYWTLRRLRCSACGETSRHYQVSWDSRNAPDVFGVPFAGANGGIQKECEVPEGFAGDMIKRNIAECEVYLSECCGEPRRNTRSYAFGDKAYRCKAVADDGTRCRLNRHSSMDLCLGPDETPDVRDTELTWTMRPTGRDARLIAAAPEMLKMLREVALLGDDEPRPLWQVIERAAALLARIDGAA